MTHYSMTESDSLQQDTEENNTPGQRLTQYTVQTVTQYTRAQIEIMPQGTTRYSAFV